jgi:hypothetical protein
MRFKLHINGDFKGIVKNLKSVNPTLATVRIDMMDIENPKMLVTNGSFLSASAIKVTDEDNNPLTVAPHDWLVLPISLFAKIKPKSGKRYRKAQYEVIIDAEKPENPYSPMVGTAEVLEDDNLTSTKVMLASSGVHHQMIVNALFPRAYEPVPDEKRAEVLKDWNGRIRIAFDVEQLQFMADLQKGANDMASSVVVFDIDAISILAENYEAPFHIVARSSDNDGKFNHNFGMLMPVMQTAKNFKPYESTSEYGKFVSKNAPKRP